MNNSNKVEMNFPRVLKCESEPEESSNGDLDDKTRVTSSVNGKTKMLGFQSNQFETTGSLVDCDVKIKQEFKDESEITRELVECFPGSGECQDQKPLQTVKHESDNENIKIENESDGFKTCFSSETFNVPTSNEQTIDKIGKNPWNTSQTQSELYYDSKNIKLLNVSVKLEDLFPTQMRKLGKAHSNTNSCVCIYCRGEYRCTSDSQLFSENLQSENQPTLVKNLSKKPKNSRKSQQGTDLQSHQTAQSNKASFQCKKCPIKFEDRNALNIHLSGHKRKRQYKSSCKFCHEQFTLMSSYYSHLTKVHNVEKPLKCEQCPASFWHRSVLETHLGVHSEERPFKCKQCPAKFKAAFSLKIHLRVHKNKRAFTCAQCPASFKFISNLNVHLRVHSGERPFECVQCPAKFRTSSALKNHLRVHSREKPFKCELCPARFTQSGAIKIHLRVHSGEKPYQCKLCPLKFAQTSALSSHITNVHSDERPLACKLCPAKFKWKVALDAHLRVHSGERPFYCEQCPSRFKSLSGLNSHIPRIHSDARPFKCALCLANFKLKSALKVHLRIHIDGKPYKCNHCRAKFTDCTALKSHLTVHRSEKPYNCAMCPSGFAHRSTLINHIKKMHNDMI